MPQLFMSKTTNKKGRRKKKQQNIISIERNFILPFFKQKMLIDMFIILYKKYFHFFRIIEKLIYNRCRAKFR